MRVVHAELHTKCPKACNKEQGWGKCQSGQCVCTLGRGSPDCSFHLGSIYGDINVFDLTEGNGLRELDLTGLLVYFAARLFSCADVSCFASLACMHVINAHIFAITCCFYRLVTKCNNL